MPLTEAEYKSLILVAVGDDAAGTLAANIDLLWNSHDTVADLPLVAALTRRDAIDLILGRVRQQVDFRTSSGSEVNLSDLFDHLLKMRAAVDEQISLAQATLGGGGALDGLTTTAPIIPATGEIDPNARVYRGDPLRRRGRGRW